MIAFERAVRWARLRSSVACGARTGRDRYDQARGELLLCIRSAFEDGCVPAALAASAALDHFDKYAPRPPAAPVVMYQVMMAATPNSITKA